MFDSLVSSEFSFSNPPYIFKLFLSMDPRIQAAAAAARGGAAERQLNHAE